jgi:hypothetical protein
LMKPPFLLPNPTQRPLDHLVRTLATWPPRGPSLSLQPPRPPSHACSTAPTRTHLHRRDAHPSVKMLSSQITPPVAPTTGPDGTTGFINMLRPPCPHRPPTVPLEGGLGQPSVRSLSASDQRPFHQTDRRSPAHPLRPLSGPLSGSRGTRGAPLARCIGAPSARHGFYLPDTASSFTSTYSRVLSPNFNRSCTGVGGGSVPSGWGGRGMGGGEWVVGSLCTNPHTPCPVLRGGRYFPSARTRNMSS